MEQPTPSKLTTQQMLNLLEIEIEITYFTTLPTDTPFLHLLAQDIDRKLAFRRKIIDAKPATTAKSEIQTKLSQLEAEFRNSIALDVDGSGDSESGSVCVCSGSEASSVYEAACMLPPEVFFESMVAPLEVKALEVSGGGKRRRRWTWRTVAVLTMVSAVLMVSVCCYLEMIQDEEFLVPT